MTQKGAKTPDKYTDVYASAKDFSLIKNGNWFMFNHWPGTDETPNVYDVQWGKPTFKPLKRNIIGTFTVNSLGSNQYSVTPDFGVGSTWTDASNVVHTITALEGHLAIDNDNTMSFTGSPGGDQNQQFAPATFTDPDGSFFIFASWSVTYT